MSQKRAKKKGAVDAPPVEEAEEEKISKLEYKVVDFMKAKLPSKRTKFLHHQVNYFYASKAVDLLLDSEWATGSEPIFTTRQSVVDFLNRLLALKFFHRAKKIAVTDKDLKPKDLKKKREKDEKMRKKKKADKGESEDIKKDDTESEKEDSKKKKKKIKLDMHLEQEFVDGNDAYVWMYDPVPFWYYIVGALCLLAAVAVCLFPLWPPSVRKGVYYLSILAAGFLGFILGLAVLRFCVFVLIWVLSMGRHHLWLLPNLTEDVGFFESFWPLFHYEYRGTDYDRKKSKKKKKVVLKTDEDSAKDKEPVSEDQSTRAEIDENASATEGERLTDVERRSGISGASDSEASQQSQTFELVDREDVGEYSTEEEANEEPEED